MAYKKECDPQDTVNGAGNGLLISVLEKLNNFKQTQETAFDWSHKSGSIDVKMDVFVLGWKSSFKMMELSSFSFQLDLGSYIVSNARMPSRKLGPWFVQLCFYLLMLLFILYKFA